MKQIIEKNYCVGCGACESICPRNCITMQQDTEGFFYPLIDTSRCIHCGMCRKVCSSFYSTYNDSVIQSYAAINKDTNKREGSSSGGVFPLLAESIIKKGGVVYGVTLSKDCKSAYHTEATTLKELDKLYGSKYLQSKIGNAYLKAKDALVNGRTVLFCGTPCQINGLKKFLQVPYANLVTVDFICHGVPSPVLWKKYVEHIENVNKIKVKEVNFRDKKRGWTNFGLRITDKKKKDIYQSKSINPYMQMFLNDLCLRPSCYECPAKTKRSSDITIGDFWGIDQVYPDMNDEKGVSILISRTKKGMELIDSISQNMIYKEVEYYKIKKHNTAESIPVDKPKERETFFQDMNRLSFSSLEKKYVNVNLKLRIRNMLDSYECVRKLLNKIAEDRKQRDI